VDSTCHSYNLSDSGALKKRFRIVARMPISFVMSVLPSLRMYQRGFHWKDFRETLYCGLSFKKLPRKSIFLIGKKVSGTLHEDLLCVLVLVTSNSQKSAPIE